MIRKYPVHFILLLAVFAGWLLLSFYNVLVDDDIVMLRSVKESGIIGATIGQYNTWNTRWMSFLLLHSWMYFWDVHSSPLLYHLITLSFLLLSFRRLVVALSSKGWINASSNAAVLVYSSLLSAALIVATYHIGDTWFWVNTSTMYGWNLIAIVFAASLTWLPLKQTLMQKILLLFSGLYVGGAAEPAVACLLLLLPAVIYFNKYENKQEKLSILLFLIGMVVSFSIALAGEGHGKRAAALPDPGGLGLIVKGAYFSAKIALFHSPLRVMMVLVLLFPLFERTQTATQVNVISDTGKVVLAWTTVILLQTFFITYIMGDYGPERAWSFLSLWTVCVGAWWLYRCGYLIPSVWKKVFSYAAGVMILIVFCYQIKTIPTYSAYVKNIRNKEVQFDSKKVPDAGLLHKISFE